MINNEAFANRLKKVLEYYQLSASAFAEKIGVQRSSISHLLSGRNKPSLDFILKVLDQFEDVTFYWLINGQGSFPKEKKIIKPQKKNNPTPTLFSNIEKEEQIKTDSKNILRNENEESNISSVKKEIDQIVIFYKDGSFKVYKN